MSYIERERLVKSIEKRRLVFKDAITVAEALEAQGRVIREEIEKAPTADVAPIADTIEELKLRIAMRFGTYTDKDMTPITEVFRLLDQIEKEMLKKKQ